MLAMSLGPVAQRHQPPPADRSTSPAKQPQNKATLCRNSLKTCEIWPETGSKPVLEEVLEQLSILLLHLQTLEILQEGSAQRHARLAAS